MAKIKMVANNLVHVSSVKAEPIEADEEFAVTEDEAAQLEEAGVAKRVTMKPAAKKKA